jgi:hypothetical protein
MWEDGQSPANFSHGPRANFGAFLGSNVLCCRPFSNFGGVTFVLRPAEDITTVRSSVRFSSTTNPVYLLEPIVVHALRRG